MTALRLTGAALVSAAVLLGVTCDRPDPLTGPSALISDGTRLGGNANFFFLPPLLPNPRGDPDYDANGFDPTAQPVVEICVLDGAACAGDQPDGFPLVFTMSGNSGSEVVRLVAADEHFIVNWHAGDFALDPDRFYRISVLLFGAPIGYADVDVVSSGRELRNVNTGEYIGLVDGRTLPITFRIERGAVVAIAVAEIVAVADATITLPPVLLTIEETVAVTDAPDLLPPVAVLVDERVSVADAVQVLPPVLVTVAELIGVSDGPSVLPPVLIAITEALTVRDDVVAAPH